MKRKFMLATLLIFVLVTLSCVSAADDIQTDDIVAIDDVQSEDISISEDVQSEDISVSEDLESEEILTEGDSGTGSLSDLKSDVVSSGTTEYNLTGNYAYNEESDGDYKCDYLVDNFVLDGKGYTINGGNQKNILNITANNVTIKNINFVNGHPAIFVGEGCKVSIISCNFTRCSADENGGAIYSSGNLSVNSCNFEINNASYYGGAIYSTGDMMVSGSDFKYNYVGGVDGQLHLIRGGAIYLGGNSSFIVNCHFISNGAPIFGTQSNGLTGNGGGAIYVAGTVKDAYILGCDFNGNSAYSGGAIRIDSYATINNCGFNGNSAYRGGAVDNEYGGSSIHNSSFESNRADESGAAIYSTKLNLTDSFFKNNSVGEKGGAVYASSATVSNSNFTDNYAKDGGAIYASSATVSNSNFTDNHANNGGAISCTNDLTIDNVSFSQNTDSSGTNNIHTNPDTEVTISNIDSGYQILADDASYSINSGGKYSVTVKDADGNALAGENLTLYVGNNIIGLGLTDENGTVSIDLSADILKGIKAGTHNLQIILGNFYQDKIVKLTINKDSAAISAIAASFVINYAGKYSVTLTNSAGEPVSAQIVTFVLNGKSIGSAKTNAKGVATLKLSANVLKAAKYGTKNLVINLNSPLYTAASKTVQVTINKEKATITAKAASFVINYAGKYSVTLTDSAGKLVSGQKVTFVLNGKSIGSANTNAKGVATIKFSAKVLKAAKYGTKNLVIKLNSPLYTAASKTIKVKIKKEKTKIVASKKSFKKGLKVKKYTVTLKNSKGKIIKKAKLTLRVKGKTFKATTNSKGKAKFKITNLKKKGKFTAYIKFKTTPYYLKKSKKVKLTIK